MSDIMKYVPLWGIWQIDSEIGSGSFSRVYKAVREEFGNKYYCAIKHISIPQSKDEIAEYYKENPTSDKSVASEYYGQIVADITNEIYTMYSLNGNTNIVNYQEHLIIEKEEGIGFDIFIKMELLTELLRKANNTQMTSKDVQKLGLDICTALEMCATMNLIHRDIKPQNIFVSKEGNYKLGDFGISRQLEKTSGGLSKKGTYNYMAPEVFRGDEYGANVDIYSLGLVMYMLLNGNKLPFMPQGNVRYDDSEKARDRRLKGETFPTPIFASDKLASIILKMCAFDRTKRYGSASAVKTDLLALTEADLITKKSTADIVTPVKDTELTSKTEITKVTAVTQSTKENDATEIIDSSYNATVSDTVLTSKMIDKKEEEEEKRKIIIPWFKNKLVIGLIAGCVLLAMGSAIILPLLNRQPTTKNDGENENKNAIVTLTLDANGGDCDSTGIEINEGATVGDLPVPTRDNYNFKGWFDAPSGGTLIDKQKQVTKEMTLYAQWETVIPDRKIFTVVLDANQGSVSRNNLTYGEGDKIGQLPTATRKDYDFLGWYTAKTNGNKITSSYQVTKDITLYAHWRDKSAPAVSYTVTFDANGGRSGTNSKNVKEGNSIGTLPSATKDYCDLIGWFTAQTGGTQVNANYTVTANTTLYAQWKDKPASAWTPVSKVPDGVKIVDSKWVYTQTKSSSTVESGYTLISTSYGAWGAWSAWQDAVITETRDPHDSSQLLKKIETQNLPATPITQYFYFRYRPTNNAWSSYSKNYASPQGVCSVYTEKKSNTELVFIDKNGTGGRYWFYKVKTSDNDADGWWYDSTTSKTVVVGTNPAKTQYRSSSRSVTYTYEKKNVESKTKPSGNGISDLVEMVKYISK